MHTGSLLFCEADEQYVTASLGRPPKGVVGVAARGPSGQPTVIINLPLQRVADRWVPFPTLYWLVSPGLSRRIAEVERKGGITELRAVLNSDPDLMEDHLADNRLYARSRWAVLNEQEKIAADEQGMCDVLRCSGVGGVQDHAQLKCLHAQYAFHLARSDVGTAVGRLMHKRFGIHPDL